MQRKEKREGNVKIKPQRDFPHLKRFKKKFPITDGTIFVYKDTIYTNNEIPYDIVHHEIMHLRRQQDIGAKKWINNYLKDDNFRLQEELIAYRYQLEKVREYNDPEELQGVLHESALNLSSSLYGNIISYAKANELLTLDK